MKLVTPQQIAGHIKLIADSGINCEQFQAFHESGRFSALLREFMVSELTIETYVVEVDYNISLADMIEAGHYDWMEEEGITAEHFPVNRRESGTMELHVVYFGFDMLIIEVLAELDRCGLRPAELPELLALGAAYLDLPRESALMALGSEWRFPNGNGHFPFLERRAHRRILNYRLNSPTHRCGDYYRIVAVSK